MFLDRFLKNEKLNQIIEKLPSNEVILKEVLGENKNKVNIELNEDSKSSYYIFLNNTIYLSNKENKKNSFDRLTVIIHEIRHSMQPKILQILNFIFSNLELLSFLICIILLFFKVNYKVLSYSYLLIIALSIIPRTVLELDAIINSIKMSKEYLLKKVSEEETNFFIKKIKIYMSILTPFMFISLYLGKFIRYFILYFLHMFLKSN